MPLKNTGKANDGQARPPSRQIPRKSRCLLTEAAAPVLPGTLLLPVAIGFGIRSPEHAASVARLADGVVVGSALVDRIAKAASKEQAVGDVLGLCRELAEGVRGARR